MGTPIRSSITRRIKPSTVFRQSFRMSFRGLRKMARAIIAIGKARMIYTAGSITCPSGIRY